MTPGRAGAGLTWRQAWGIFLILAAAYVIAAGNLGGIAMFSPDTNQYVSSARSLVAGDGYTTSLLAWDPQLEQGFPAAQTVWPPGYPALLAAAGFVTGDDPAANVSVVAATALVLGGAGVLALLAALGLSPGWAVVATAAPLSLIELFGNACMGWSEAPYVGVALPAVIALSLAVCDARHRWRWCVVGTALALGAFFIRYIGIVLVVQALLTVAVVVWLDSDRPWTVRLRRSAVLCALVGLVCGGWFLRNLLVVGSLTGGPVVPANRPLLSLLSDSAASLGMVVAPGVRGIGIEGSALLFTALVVAAAVTLIERNIRSTTGTGAAARLRDLAGRPIVVAVCMIGVHCFSYMLLILAMARGNASYWMIMRFFLPVAAFGALAAALCFAYPKASNAWQDRAIQVLGLSALVLLLLGQSSVAVSDRSWSDARSRGVALIQALQATASTGETNADFIRRLAGVDGSVLIMAPNTIHAHVGVRMIALPPPMYSQQVWDESSVRLLVERLDVRAVVFTPELVKAFSAFMDGIPFYVQLRDERPPCWLRMASSSAGVEVMEVVPCATDGVVSAPMGSRQ